MLIGLLYYTTKLYSKTCVKRPLSKRPKIGFQDQFSLNAGQKYSRMLPDCRMLQWEHSAILLTFIKLPFVIKIFVLSNFKWLLYTGFTVVSFSMLISDRGILMTYGSGANGCLGHGNFNDVTQVKLL